jgi:hypothetical protein
MLTIALVLSAATLIGSLAFQVFERRTRARRFRSLVLKPNCLLTRHPIVFLAGPRTVFRLFDHWNSVPLYLREHGYDVYVIDPSGAKRAARTASVLSALRSLGRCHLIADGSLEEDLEEIATLRPLEAASYTLVKTPDRERYLKPSGPRIDARDLKPSLVDVYTIEGRGAQGFMSKTKLVLLMAHNFLIQRRSHFVHPFETAEVSPESFANEERFLDLAISLAERDFSTT